MLATLELMAEDEPTRDWQGRQKANTSPPLMPAPKGKEGEDTGLFGWLPKSCPLLGPEY